ncbi:MAG: mannosyl-3-phosphoglycerate phosphatase MpgP [Rhodobacteraceae bacterium HLUCCA08]|nr:MAG: mannosyl-3-phosphoglycerate phosphatase MpgP [Rhodobacteraceae bacterium HLUCCA08]
MRLLVFTDLDGTLLDHDSYDFTPARPALAALAARGVPVILASSKTAAEIAPLQAALGLTGQPAIVENGAALADGASDDSGWRSIRQALEELPPALRAPFRGFGDMDRAEVAKVTGLPPDQAALARRRQHSEPGLWTGSDAARAEFEAALAARGITARRGGRFLTLSHGATKADRMAELTARLGPAHTVALGDAPNDAEMLQAADTGIIVANPHGPGLPPLPGEATGRIRRTADPGPLGWNTALLDLLAELSPPPERARHG